MRKSEIFNKVLDIVAAETEVSQACILSRCRRREVVDARYLLVKALLEAGFYKNEIARFARLTNRAVEIMSSKFNDRQEQSGRMFNIMNQRISSSVSDITHSLMSC